MDRLLYYRDLAGEEVPSFIGMPEAFFDWTWHGWLPAVVFTMTVMRLLICVIGSKTSWITPVLGDEYSIH